MSTPRRLAPTGLVGALLAATLAGLGGADAAAPPLVVEVPARPAFVTAPGRLERPAQVGQGLPARTLLRTERPGRLQVRLPDGRSFRLGGDALLRLAGTRLELERGQIIAWVNPGSSGGAPLQLRTRVGTVSIVGTTVFLEVTATAVKVFSWEGRVQVLSDSGERFSLGSGQQLTYGPAPRWQGPVRLSRPEIEARRSSSLLLNGFQAPMETMASIESELGFRR